MSASSLNRRILTILLAISFVQHFDFSNAFAESNDFDLLKQQSTFILKDQNADGIIEIMAFGDSITRGVGDFFEPGEFVPLIEEPPGTEAGYPLRIENWLGLPVSNRGRPGERVHVTGVTRFASNIRNSQSDYVVISGGANDAFSLYGDTFLARDIQSMINMARAMDREPILMTIPPACCGRAGLKPSITNYNVRYRDLAAVNRIPLVDVERGFNFLCPGNRCYLFNLPEGLHPNKTGYDVFGELFSALFNGIDLFAPGGSALLAQILGRPESELLIKSPVATPVNGSERKSYFEESMYDPLDYLNVLDD
ncbi:MAG TPA: SGNH/GDSL hydrolase family protein [Oligoflexia bacterium]|nr:SGNH/GDSL hydrolase family protein [Oligoflexia bacterium]HMP48247.1 SGNH/GDSL hydrolase family protein [Oligoflexia bacterium]